MGVAIRVVQAVVVLGVAAGGLLLASRHWPASALEQQTRAALEAPRDWPGSNAWADMLFIARDDLDATGRQAALAAHVAEVEHWQQQRQALLREHAGKALEDVALPKPPSLVLGRAAPVPAAFNACVNGTPQACLTAVRGSLAAATQWRADHAGYLERVAGLSAHGHLASPYSRPNALLTMHHPLMARPAPQGRIAQAVAYLHGDPATALTGACLDLQTSRLLATHSDSHLATQQGARGLELGAQWLATLAGDWPAATPLPAACDGVAAPLPVEAVSACAAFAGDNALALATLADSLVAAGDQGPSGWWFDLDKTADRFAAHAGRSCLPPARAEIAADQPVTLQADALAAVWHIRCLANLGGCSLGSDATPALHAYVLRMQDAAASQRLLGAWLWLRQQPQQDDLAKVLAQIPAQYQSAPRPVALSADGQALELARYHATGQGGSTLQLPLPAAWRSAAAPQ